MTDVKIEASGDFVAVEIDGDTFVYPDDPDGREAMACRLINYDLLFGE